MSAGLQHNQPIAADVPCVPCHGMLLPKEDEGLHATSPACLTAHSTQRGLRAAAGAVLLLLLPLRLQVHERLRQAVQRTC